MVGQIILSRILKCLEPGAKDTEIRGGRQSTGWCSSCVGKRIRGSGIHRFV